MALTIPSMTPAPNAFGATLTNYQNQQPTSSTPIFAWGNGQEEADRFPVPANTWAIIMDRGQDVFYIKRRDAYGNAYPLEIYDFTKRVVTDPNAPVGRDEFNNLTKIVTRMSEQMNKVIDDLGINNTKEAEA